MKKTDEDDIYIYYEAIYKGFPISIRHCKQTGEIFFNADDVCRLLGDGDFKAYLGTDEGLDFINDMKRKYPDRKVFGDMIR